MEENSDASILIFTSGRNLNHPLPRNASRSKKRPWCSREIKDVHFTRKTGRVEFTNQQDSKKVSPAIFFYILPM
jgi:hypothetical protein